MLSDNCTDIWDSCRAIAETAALKLVVIWYKYDTMLRKNPTFLSSETTLLTLFSGTMRMMIQKRRRGVFWLKR